MKKLATLLLLLWGLPSLAQQGATSELTGRVASAGQALPGVTVTLTSNSLLRNRVTITGENGGYRVALLPPGDYLVRAGLEGFTSIEKHAQVSLATTTRIDIELQPAPFRETVTVTSDRAPAADASVATNFRAAELQRLPGSRDIRAAVLLSPGANALGTRNRLVIAGAASWDSLFLVDGVVVNEYLSGQPHNIVLEDAIQEIALLTGGISAEFGRFTGGVVSTLTKSGGNEFNGSVRDTVTNDAWTKQTPWPDQPRALDKTNHAGEGTLGGFLLKDRLWFFAAARTAHAASRQFTAALTNIPYRSDSHDRRWEGKITDQITLHHSLILAYGDTSSIETNVLAERGGTALDLATLIPKRWQPTRFVALTYNGVLAPNWSAEIHDSQKRYALRGNGGRSYDSILGTLIQARGGGNLNAPLGCGICGDDERDSNSWIAKNSYYRNTRWGNHTATAGAEGFQEKRSNLGTRSSSEFNIQSGSPRIVGSVAYPRFDSTTQIDWTRPFPSADAHLNSWSGYVNDRWDLGSRLSMNLGVRYDRNNARGAAGERIADDGAFSPRLSATFDVRNDGRHRLFAGYARYAAKILEGGASPQQVGTFSTLGWNYGGPEINGAATPNDQLLSAHEALARLFGWFDSVGGIQNPNPSFITDPASSSIFPRSLKSPAVDDRSIGYAMQFHNGYVRADFVSRDWRDFYAARVDTSTGQQLDAVGRKLDVAWIVNDNSETVRTYRAMQLQGSWRGRGASLGGGYTWSKLRGNDEAEEGTTGQSPRNLPLGLWYPEFLGYAQRRPIGYLKQDQRHRARVWFGYEAALSRGTVSTSLLQWFDSGHPYSAVADIDPTGGTVPYEGIPANPGYALNQVKIGPYFFSKRGAFRTDNVFSSDAAVNYETPYRGFRLFVKGDVLNLLNNAAIVSPGTNVMTRFRNGAGSGLRAFNPFTETPVEGVHYRLSPDFGRATGPDSYQTPRTFEMSFGARF